MDMSKQTVANAKKKAHDATIASNQATQDVDTALAVAEKAVDEALAAAKTAGDNT